MHSIEIATRFKRDSVEYRYEQMIFTNNKYFGLVLKQLKTDYFFKILK